MTTRFEQSPTAPEFVQNPYPFYDRARPTGPFFDWADYGHLCSASYEVVSALLRDRRFGRELPAGLSRDIPDHLKPFYDFESHSMLEREPPTHTRLRSLVVRAFTSRQIAALAPGIEALCHELVDRFPDGQFDLLQHYAETIPVIVIARLLGVPEEMAPQLLRWSHDMVAMYQAGRSRKIEDDAVAATLAFSAYLRDLIAARRKAPGNDLLSSLIAARDDGDRLSEDELISTSVLLLNAGHEATVHAIGNATKTLLELEYRGEISDAVIEETLRYDPPLHMFTRFAMEDIEVFGQQFAKGQVVGLLLAGANRDATKYAKPNAFDPVRGGLGNTSFGAGLHFCVGAPLARLELAYALPILFSRLPRLQLAAAPLYANRYHFHGLERLMLTSA
ncbi:cytochrome P450 [Abyssibius alkaniclasticus]|uniref:cytochrome P450 n=1 Tax=Abyssibius alkaniclasticus TaxID=2881234 RepID=UPI002364A412|nr:cytochrome P450 [Abyssibius alkaniclasticus]UPH70780.1 cytochrome P450 [Abyssibius alkaniclasticus]